MQNIRDDVRTRPSNIWLEVCPNVNHLVKRDIRMMKVKQKITDTFRTRDGIAVFCDICTCIFATRKQGSLLSLLEWLPFNKSNELS